MFSKRTTKFISFLLLLVFTLCQQAVSIDAKKSPLHLSDIGDLESKDTIMDWVNKGYLTGYEDQTFRPASPVTRAEFITLFSRVFDLKKTHEVDSSSFLDVKPSAWYFNTVKLCTDLKIINGYTDGRFGPDDTITRQDASVILARYLNIDDFCSPDYLKTYTDADSISNYATVSLASLEELALLDGLATEHFLPLEPITRLDSVLLLNNALKLLDKGPGLKGRLYGDSIKLNVSKIAVYKQGTTKLIKKMTPNKKGEFQLNLKNGTYDIVVTNKNYVAGKSNISVHNRNRYIKLELAQGQKTTGVILSSTGKPLTSETLYVKSDVVYPFKTNGKGQYQLYLPPNASYQLLYKKNNTYHVAKDFATTDIAHELQLGSIKVDLKNTSSAYTPSSSSGTVPVTPAPLPKVKKPLVQPVDGLVRLDTALRLTPQTLDSTIRYTFGDGTQSPPTLDSGVLYDDATKPIITSSGVYKIKAFKAGMEASDTVKSTFRVQDALNGYALNDENQPLAHHALQFTSSQDDFTITTDSSGFFSTNIDINDSYHVTSTNINAMIISTGKTGGTTVNNQLGKISLGLNLVSNENQVVLHSGVFMPDAEDFVVDSTSPDDTVTFTSTYHYLAGDIIVLPPSPDYPAGRAVRIKEIDTNGNALLDPEPPEIEEVFRSIKGSTKLQLNEDYFTPAEGVTIVPQQSPQESPGPMRSTSVNTNSVTINGNSITTSFKIPSNSLKCTGSLTLSGEMNGDIDWAWEPDLVDSFDFSIKASQQLACTVELLSASGSYEPKHKIGDYIIPTSIPLITVSFPVYLKFTASGKAEIDFSVTAKEHIGIHYEDGAGLSLYPDDKFKIEIAEPALKISSEVTAGISQDVSVNVATLNLVGIAEIMGLYGTMSNDVTNNIEEIEFGAFYKMQLYSKLFDWEEDLSEVRHKFGSISTDDSYRDLRVLPDSLELFPGETRQLNIQALTKDNQWIDLPESKYSSLSFDSTRPWVTDLGSGRIRIAENAQDGLVMVTYSIDGLTKTISVNIISTYGRLEGIVRDASTKEPLAGVQIQLFHDGQLINRSILTDDEGRYALGLPTGSDYSAKITKPGYQPAHYKDIIISTDVTKHLEPVLQISEAYSGRGTVSGTILNALDGHGVSGITLELYEGINNSTGTVLTRTQTASNGQYVFDNLQAGHYTAKILGDGYETSHFTLICLGGALFDHQDATITPIMVDGETRIVLTWGATPRDLDSHLTGPTPSTSRFHIFFNKKSYSSYADLDLDDQESYGPETTTIRRQLDGTYRFSVHDYTNKGTSNNTALSNSGATVKVYRSGQLLATYYVPVGRKGNLWTVFDIKGNQIIPINKMLDSMDSLDLLHPTDSEFDMRVNSLNSRFELPDKSGLKVVPDELPPPEKAKHTTSSILIFD